MSCIADNVSYKLLHGTVVVIIVILMIEWFYVGSCCAGFWTLNKLDVAMFIDNSSRHCMPKRLKMMYSERKYARKQQQERQIDRHIVSLCLFRKYTGWSKKADAHTVSRVSVFLGPPCRERRCPLTAGRRGHGSIWWVSAEVCLNEFLGPRSGFNWWEAWGPVYLGGTGRLQQLYD